MIRLRATVLSTAIVLIACASAGFAANPVIDAVKKGDRAALRALLGPRADVRAAVEPDGTTALHWAAHLDDTESAAMLLRAGADVNAANQHAVIPLTLAAINGNASMIELLLKAGANPNAAVREGETALMTAARTGNLQAVKLLLAHGADVNAKETWRGQTSLMWAAVEDHSDVVRLLVRSGADLNVRSNGGFTAFIFAVRQGHIDVVGALLDAGVDVNETLDVKVILRVRPRFPAPEHGPSAMVLAVANANYELAALLLDRGADPNSSTQGWTALHQITWVRKPGTGSNNPAPETSGNMDSLQIVRKLVAHGADVNARVTRPTNAGLHSLNTIGATPFLLAARTADAELMGLLVELGADPLLPNEDNTTPLMVAAGVGTRSPGEDAGTPQEVLEAVKAALEFGGDMNAADNNGETALHGAAYKHAPAAAQLLAQKVEDRLFGQKNRNGWTPLRIAMGVHRGMNLRSSPETAEVLRREMTARGLSTEVEPEAVISGETR